MKNKAKEVFVRLRGFDDLVISKEEWEKDNYDTDCPYHFIGFQDINGEECDEDGIYLNQKFKPKQR